MAWFPVLIFVLTSSVPLHLSNHHRLFEGCPVERGPNTPFHDNWDEWHRVSKETCRVELPQGWKLCPSLTALHHCSYYCPPLAFTSEILPLIECEKVVDGGYNTAGFLEAYAPRSPIEISSRWKYWDEEKKQFIFEADESELFKLTAEELNQIDEVAQELVHAARNYEILYREKEAVDKQITKEEVTLVLKHHLGSAREIFQRQCNVLIKYVEQELIQEGSQKNTFITFIENNNQLLEVYENKIMQHNIEGFDIVSSVRDIKRQARTCFNTEISNFELILGAAKKEFLSVKERAKAKHLEIGEHYVKVFLKDAFGFEEDVPITNIGGLNLRYGGVSYDFEKTIKKQTSKANVHVDLSPSKVGQMWLPVMGGAFEDEYGNWNQLIEVNVWFAMQHPQSCPLVVWELESGEVALRFKKYVPIEPIPSKEPFFSSEKVHEWQPVCFGASQQFHGVVQLESELGKERASVDMRFTIPFAQILKFVVSQGSPLHLTNFAIYTAKPMWLSDELDKKTRDLK